MWWRRPLVKFGWRRCVHLWGHWWIAADTGLAARSCIWCGQPQTEQLAVFRPRHRRPSRSPGRVYAWQLR
jgi:hypothetical protein